MRENLRSWEDGGFFYSHPWAAYIENAHCVLLNISSFHHATNLGKSPPVLGSGEGSALSTVFTVIYSTLWMQFSAVNSSELIHLTVEITEESFIINSGAKLSESLYESRESHMRSGCNNTTYVWFFVPDLSLVFVTGSVFVWKEDYFWNSVQ